MEHVHRAAALPLYVVGWRHESEALDVKMMEGVTFAKGWRNIPATAKLELRSEGKLQVYDANVVFTARLRGLRYLMYNHRIISFLVLTSTFWIVEMGFAGMVWIVLSIFLFPGNAYTGSARTKAEESTLVKKEERHGDHSDDMSDTPHTFPTLSGHPPLQYSSPRVKKEDEPEPSLAETHPLEADDEEDDDFILDGGRPFGRGVSDSGIGTSLESSGGRPERVRARTSRMSSGGQ